MKQDRQEGGKFAPKSEEPREVRSIRLTDRVWDKLGELAEVRDLTRADLIEEAVDSGAFEVDYLKQVLIAIDEILNDEKVTRKGKDRGAVKRGLEALLARLKSV